MAGVLFGATGQMRERIRFDGMDQRTGFSGRRNQVIPAPRGQMTALTGYCRDVRGDRIQAAKVVQQPGVNPVFFQGGAHRLEVEHGAGRGSAGGAHRSSIDGGRESPH